MDESVRSLVVRREKGTTELHEPEPMSRLGLAAGSGENLSVAASGAEHLPGRGLMGGGIWECLGLGVGVGPLWRLLTGSRWPAAEPRSRPLHSRRRRLL